MAAKKTADAESTQTTDRAEDESATSGDDGGARETQVEQSSDKSAKDKPARDEKPAKEKKPKKDRQTGKKLLAGANALRTRIATVVWLIAVVCALFLAVGALLVALKMNGDNAIVGFIRDGAGRLDLGKFKEFTGKNHLIKDRLTNWGIAAVIYLVVGKILDRIIRP